MHLWNFMSVIHKQFIRFFQNRRHVLCSCKFAPGAEHMASERVLTIASSEVSFLLLGK